MKIQSKLTSHQPGKHARAFEEHWVSRLNQTKPSSAALGGASVRSRDRGDLLLTFSEVSTAKTYGKEGDL